ncbi:MAG: transcription termination factor Rho [Lachnospiraceae bacterium]|nr:transcription termination factor Rho [Lachnospiraceae bacterium]
MKEKLMTLPLAELKNFARDNHIPNYYRLKKAELVDALAALDAAKKAEATAAKSTRGRRPSKAPEKQNESSSAPEKKAGRPGRKPGRKPSMKPAAPQDPPTAQIEPIEVPSQPEVPAQPVDAAVPAQSEARTAPSQPSNNAGPAQAEKRPYTPRKKSYQNRSNNKGYWYPPNTDGTNFETQSRVAERSQESDKAQENPDLNPPASDYTLPKTVQDFETGLKTEGILEVLQDGYGFIRSNGLFSGNDDVYVAPSQIRRFNLKTGDCLVGTIRQKLPQEKYSAILFIETINGFTCDEHSKIIPFENQTPVFPHERLHLEYPGCDTSLRIVDLISPIGKGQRGMIVAQPKVGKTTILKQITRALVRNHPELYVMILLIDERPEEVTDMQDTFKGTNVQIEYSTFDELPEHHKKVTEMVMERAKRLAECGQDVVILTDSITRMARAYNLTVAPSGRTLSGGLDPAALYTPKKFFGSARALKEGGSLTILATALQETGSRMDDMVYEEFKGTGNMELVLSRKLSERRIFPAIDILKSSTRRDDLLLSPEEQDALKKIHAVTAGERDQDLATERILDTFAATKSNAEFIAKFRYVIF